jgi:hypothetical protein
MDQVIATFFPPKNLTFCCAGNIPVTISVDVGWAGIPGFLKCIFNRMPDPLTIQWRAIIE